MVKKQTNKAYEYRCKPISPPSFYLSFHIDHDSGNSIFDSLTQRGNCLHEWMQSHTGCIYFTFQMFPGYICLTFHHCVCFQMCPKITCLIGCIVTSVIGCICLTCHRCVFSNASSGHLHEGMNNHTDCICLYSKVN